MSKKSVYVITNHLERYAGSEVVTLEVCLAFKRQGCDVSILSNLLANPIRQHFEDAGVHILDLHSNHPKPDLIWVHHQGLPMLSGWERFFKDRGPESHPTVIFNHMSPFEPLEFSWLYELEANVAAKIFVNSEETGAQLEKHYPNLKQKITVLPNPAPEYLFPVLQAQDLVNSTVDYLIVSNHIPPELLEAKDRLEAQGLRFRVIGAGYEEKMLQSEDLMVTKGVITIGKTTQYAILSGVPVYNYDHFGGWGWLCSQNIEQAAFYNYSGRGGGEKKDSESIFNELYSISDAKLVEQRSDFLARRDKYIMESYLTPDLFETFALTSVSDFEAIAWRANSLHNLVYSYKDRYTDLPYRVSLLTENNKRLTDENNILDEQLKAAKAMLQRRAVRVVLGVVDPMALFFRKLWANVRQYS